VKLDWHVCAADDCDAASTIQSALEADEDGGKDDDEHSKPIEASKTAADLVVLGAQSKGLGSSKVQPIDHGPEFDRETGSISSKSTSSSIHKAIENGKSYEEHGLVLLRKLLMIVSVFVVALSMATMTISKNVISGGVDSVHLTALEGSRETYHQVIEESSYTVLECIACTLKRVPVLFTLAENCVLDANAANQRCWWRDTDELRKNGWQINEAFGNFGRS
jgi:hypothetical protein